MAGSWGQMPWSQALGTLRVWLGVLGGWGLAKTEEAAAGTDSPFPRGSVLPLSQAPPGQGRGTGGGAASLGPGQVRGSASQGLGLGPGPKGRAGPGERMSWLRAHLSSHMAEGRRPGRSEAAAAGEGRHPRTECPSPSSRGRARLSRSCSGWCGHTSGKPLPRSHP